MWDLTTLSNHIYPDGLIPLISTSIRIQRCALFSGRQLDGALPDPLRGEALPVLGVQPPVLAVEQRHHAHAHAQRREAVQVGGFKAFTESASSSHTRLIWRKFPTRLLHTCI